MICPCTTGRSGSGRTRRQESLGVGHPGAYGRVWLRPLQATHVLGSEAAAASHDLGSEAVAAATAAPRAGEPVADAAAASERLQHAEGWRQEDAGGD